MARAALFVAMLAGGLVPSSLSAQSLLDSTDQGQARAQVVTNLQVTPLADLQFGAIVVGVGEPGRVTIGAGAGPAIFLGSARSGCSDAGGCSAHPASFRVNGEASRTYRITITGIVQARGQAWGGTLEVSDLTLLSANMVNAAGLGQLDAAGLDHFTVGGTLEVPAGTTPDIFRAELPVTVSYE